MLGWIRTEDLEGQQRDFYVRQLWDAKGSALVEVMEPNVMAIYADALRADPREGARALRRRGRDRGLSRR